MQYTVTIPAQTARHVLWQYGAEGGWQPGSFTQHLLSAFGAADPTHHHRLATAFPDYGAAAWMAKHDRDGLQKLRQIAEAGR